MTVPSTPQAPRRPRRDLPPRRLFWSALLFAATLTGLLYSVYGSVPALRVGDPSPQTFRAPFDLVAVDRVATERARSAARAQIGLLYTTSPERQHLVLSELAATDLPEPVRRFLNEAYSHPDGVSEAELPNLIREATALADESARDAVRSTLQRFLLATTEPSARLTEAARAAAAESVEPVMRTLEAGEVIVRRGDPLTDDALRVLEAAGLYTPRSDQLEQSLTLVLVCALLALFLTLPLLHFYRALRARITVGQLAFLVLLWALGLLLQRLAFLASPYLLFIAFLPLLVAVLANERDAFVLAVWLAVIAALLNPSDTFFQPLAALAGSTTAALFARTFHARPALLVTGLLSGAVAAVTFALCSALVGGLSNLGTLGTLAWLLGGGVLAGILALAALPFAESNLGFLTEFRLLELTSPSNPLLQKLLLEAPGTYQHSLIISNLVAQAVANIGGDPLLARVGALYHDVGKLRRPQFFTENQFVGENPHDRISPHLSYLIITSHVRDGVELLREYGLPAALEPFVTEHHGTTVLSYFYKRALESSERVDELNFRYAGPRPQSRETAVLMLADAVESASRSLTEPTQGSVRAMIDRLIEQRLQDDQLAQSPLNFHDLEVIANTFERLLTAVLHRRVSYPSGEELDRLKRDRDSRRASVPLSRAASGGDRNA
jgi:putative nucleotidyltransferase with HDIG domain